MIIKLARKLLILLLLIRYMIFPVFCEKNKTNLKGFELTQTVRSILEEKGFSTSKNSLCATGDDIFAYNIIILLPALKETEALFAENSKRNLIILMTQEDFYENQDSFLQLIEYAASQKYEYSVEFVFTALDSTVRLKEKNTLQQTGTEIFAESILEEQESATLILSVVKEMREKSKIYTTGFKKSSPLWLTKRTVESFVSEKIPFSSPQKFLSIYRAGLLSGDRQISAFFANSIPCIKVELANSEHLLAIKNFLDSYTILGTENEDVHYTFFTVPFVRTFWINERLNIIALELFGGFGILLLCSFSFIGKKRIKYKKAFSKNWYIIPLTLLVSLISLYAGQFCCENIKFIARANPLSQFGYKIILSMIFISVLFTLQQHLNSEVSEFIYGYNLTLIALANVFIFSLADITLFWVFAFEFFVIYLSRSQTKNHILVIILALMILPFVPYLAVIAGNATRQDMHAIVISSIQRNIMFALALFPFQIMWLRMLVRLTTYKSKSNGVKTPLKTLFQYGAISFAIILLVVLLFLFAMNTFLYKKTQSENKILTSTDAASKTIFAEEKSNYTIYKGSRLLKISSNENAVRYIVTMSSPISVPVLDSTYEYKVKENSTLVEFIIPDYPNKNISINYSTEPSTSRTIKITAIYETENPSIYRKEVLTLDCPSEVFKESAGT
mgnify:CR=1 FL=1